ncbi:hypothetical protein [Nocardia sp. NPDC055049]
MHSSECDELKDLLRGDLKQVGVVVDGGGLVGNDHRRPALISARTRDPGGSLVFDDADLPTQFSDLSVALGTAFSDRVPPGQIAAHRCGGRAVTFASEFTATTHTLA